MKTISTFIFTIVLASLLLLTTSNNGVQSSSVAVSTSTGMQLIKNFAALQQQKLLQKHHVAPPSLHNSTPSATCAYNMSNTVQYLTFLGELTHLMGLTNWTSRCDYWPTISPCIPVWLATLDPKDPNTISMNATFSLYVPFCSKVGNSTCYTIADAFSTRHQCYSESPSKGSGCSKTACLTSISGDSCIPRASPEFFGAYCNGCFPKVRSALLNYYNVVASNSSSSSSSSSSSDSWSDSSESSSGSSGGDTQPSDFGIILTEAGFAAVDARANNICNNNCTTFIGQFTSQEDFTEPLSRLLFDFSVGAPSFLTSSSSSSTRSAIINLSQLTCGTTSNLRCFRRFVSAWLNSNRVLTSYLEQTCEKGSRKASSAVCSLESNSLKSRAEWWNNEYANTKSMMCGQTGNSGFAKSAPNCLAVPAASYTSAVSGSCFQQAFSSSANISTSCMTNITTTLTGWGCCVQNLINYESSPELNPAVKSWVKNFVNDTIVGKKISGCVINPNTSYNASYTKDVGMRFTTLPYSVVNGNETLYNSLTSAVLGDISGALGVSRMNLRSFQLVPANLVGASSQDDETSSSSGAFFSASSSIIKNTALPLDQQAALIITLGTESNSDLASISASFNSWVSGSSPSSPEVNTLLADSGYGSDVGSSSVAYYAPPAPLHTTAAPGGGGGNGGNGGNGNTGLIAGAAVGGVLGIGLLVFVFYRVSRRKNGGGGGGVSERGSEIGEYAEVQ